jgi:hypothetical protein
VVIGAGTTEGDLSITDADLGRPYVVGGPSIYPAVENLLLVCRAEGLGAVPTCVGPRHRGPRLTQACSDLMSAGTTLA